MRLTVVTAKLGIYSAGARLRWSNRILILNHTQQEIITGPQGPHFDFWRWGESCAEDALQHPTLLFPYRRSFLDSLGWGESTANDALLAPDSFA